MAIIDSRVGRRAHPRFPGDPSIEQKQQRGPETDPGAIGETAKDICASHEPNPAQ